MQGCHFCLNSALFRTEAAAALSVQCRQGVVPAVCGCTCQYGRRVDVPGFSGHSPFPYLYTPGLVSLWCFPACGRTKIKSAPMRYTVFISQSLVKVRPRPLAILTLSGELIIKFSLNVVSGWMVLSLSHSRRVTTCFLCSFMALKLQNCLLRGPTHP